MSDADLEAKFLDLAEGVLPDAQARALMRPVLEGREPAQRRGAGDGGRARSRSA